MEGRVNFLDEIMSDLSSSDEDKKKEEKPIVPLSNPIAMYYELNPRLEMMEQCVNPKNKEGLQAEEDCSQALLPSIR